MLACLFSLDIHIYIPYSMTVQYCIIFLKGKGHCHAISDSPGGGGLPYMGYIGTWRWTGYGS